jgi:hypothetical protein
MSSKTFTAKVWSFIEHVFFTKIKNNKKEKNTREKDMFYLTITKELKEEKCFVMSIQFHH